MGGPGTSLPRERPASRRGATANGRSRSRGITLDLPNNKGDDHVFKLEPGER
jgi:hypothetical protein